MHRWGNKKDMAGDDPPFLSVGTEVSAKYKGAFCEAKIRKVVKSVKCKVQYKNEQGSVFVNDEQIKGLLMSGRSVEVKLPDKKESIEGTVVKIQDLSQYTVVFDDGDIATLRRTALCLKSGRHFAESETLDQLPLTHPEHFSSPVVSGARGSRRRDDMDENSDDEEKHQKIKREEDMGKVVCVEIGDKKKSKDNWFPGLIVAPNAQDSVKIDVEDEYLIRSFKDGRYYTVPKSETVEFTREMSVKIENPTLRQAVEKAILFLDKSDLPAHWDRDQLFGIVDFPSDIDASDTDSMDDEPREEKDHFVAQLYKFMDDRGTPINKGPMISSRDVDLYKLFKIVYKIGGYNRVTNRNQWKCVAIKSGYNVSQTNNVKSSYKKYLHSFEDFYRKLGCTLLTTSKDNKLRSRSSRPLIRDRDKTVSEKPLEKEETASYNEDACEAKQIHSLKGKSLEVLVKDAEDIGCKNSEVKKEKVTIRNRDHNADDTKEQKNDYNIIDPFTVQLIHFKDIKEDKLVPEKRAERKSMKLISKLDEGSDMKVADRLLFKTKTKKAKSVEKRIKKAEVVLSQLKEKRSLKERIKAVVNKLKLKSISSSDEDKKNKKTAEEMNKLLLQGQRVKLKEDHLKSRKLSLGSFDGKCSTSSDKKFGGSSNSINSLSESTSSSSGSSSKPKKNDEDGAETSRKKTTSRKRKDDDKLSDASFESLINQAIEFVPHYKTICIGDKLKVYYEPTHESKVTYEAKVTNKRYGSVTEYLVHYTGWNTRYDEWIRRSRIADNLSWTPSRSKRKHNQADLFPSNQTPGVLAEQQNWQNHNNDKSEKSKCSPMSPIAKNRNKMSVESGMKQMKNIKSRLECKSKMNALQKHSDTGSDSEDESKQKLLQKTRSRTEKQKMQDEDGDVKKRTTSLKRTRSRSIKLGNKVTKKRKLSSTAGKMNNATNIRSSIMKAFVPRKRAYNRSKDLKEMKESCDALLMNELTDDDVENSSDFSIPEIKPCSNDLDKRKYASNIVTEMEVEDNLILKLRPITPDKIVREISDDEAITLSDNKEVSQSTNDITWKKVLVKKEPINEEENGINQHLADSYLAENIRISKSKVVKAQIKVDEKNISPLKSTSRVLEKSTVGKSPCEVKDKIIFTSRSPSEKKNEKTPEKEVKFKSITTFSSYLNIEKIDSMKKNVKDKTEKPNSILKTSDFSEDDIYEFKEPEPLVIDDRAILHRRITRFFEDNSYKRIKPLMSTVDYVIKEIDEPSQLLEDMNIVETKSISVPCKEDVEIIENTKDDFTNEKIVEIDTRSSADMKEQSAENEKDRVQEDLSKSDVKPKLVNTTQTVAALNNICLPILTCKEHLGGTDVDSSEEDDDGNEAKLIISEADLISIHDKNSSRKPVSKGMSSVDLIIDSVAIDENFLDSERVKIKSSIDRNRVSDTNKFNVQWTATATNDTVPKKIVLLEEKSAVSCDDEKRFESSNVEVRDKVTKKSTINSDHSVQRPKLSFNNSTSSTHRESYGEAECKLADEAISQGDIFNGVVIEACSMNGKGMKIEEVMDVDEISKLKEDENTENGGLLLCGETIPKSPEIKEAGANDVFVDFMDSGTKKPTTQLVKPKKEAKPGNRNMFEGSPPMTPEGSQSTPGMSPSDVGENVTASAFTLNEKSFGSNKNSSENETFSDMSEKRTISQNYSNEAYIKRNAYEFESYLKRKADHHGSSKSEDGERKHIKNNVAVNGNDKEDSNDARTESSVTHSNPSVLSILEEIPFHYDSNQRIEFLEQKLQQMRDKYNEYKQEVAVIDKKRKKLKRREREGRMMTRNEANSLL